jgi:hypothetical protein
MVGNDEDRCRGMRLGVDDQAQVKYLVAERSGGRVMRIVHVEETRSAGIPVYPQNRWLGIGPACTILSD